MASRAVASATRRYAPADTRERVLAAAQALFSTRGFAATGTADIAREANVSEGSIFYHFGSKQQLLASIGAIYGEMMIAAMQGNDHLGDLDLGDAIKRCIAFRIDHQACSDRARSNHAPAPSVCGEAEQFFQAARQVTVAWIASVLAGSQAADTGINHKASLTFAVVGEAIRLTMLASDEAQRLAVIAETVRFVRAAVALEVAR